MCSGSKAIKAAFLNAPRSDFKVALFFPPPSEARWEKGHHRIECRRLARVEVTPEEIGLCGCWQVIAVERVREPLGKGDRPDPEIAYYATSLSSRERSEEQLMELIRGHWAAIENGIHHRRDVSFAEDCCRITKNGGAQVMASLRNLAIGIYDLQKDQGRTRASSLTSWMRQMTPSRALKLLSR